jgi:hypothetical protein
MTTNHCCIYTVPQLPPTGLFRKGDILAGEKSPADKFMALALRRGRIKFRDIWYIHWLTQSTVTLNLSWVHL